MQFQPTVKRRELAERSEDERNKRAAGMVGCHLTMPRAEQVLGKGDAEEGRGQGGWGLMGARQAGSQEGRGTVRSAGSEDGAQRACPHGQGLHIHRDLPRLSLR